MMRILDTQWNGERSDKQLRYALVEKQDELSFSVEFPVNVKGHPDAAEGVYTPELWKWDVAEIFLTGESGRYIEVNLAPNGAFWIQGFTDVRQADSGFDWQRVFSRSSASGLTLSLKGLEDYLGSPASWRGNVTAILGSPDYLFLSAVKLPGNEADFHQPASFFSYKSFITS